MPRLASEVATAAGTPTLRMASVGAGPRCRSSAGLIAARAPEHPAQARQQRDRLAGEHRDRRADEPEPHAEHQDGRDRNLSKQRGAGPDRRHAHVALAAQDAVEHARGERDRSAAEQDVREAARPVEHRAVRAHQTKKGRDADPGGEREEDAGRDRHDDGVARDGARFFGAPSAERPRDRRRRAGAEAAGHRGRGEQRHGKHQGHRADGVGAEPADVVGQCHVRRRRHAHHEHRRRTELYDGVERRHRQQLASPSGSLRSHVRPRIPAARPDNQRSGKWYLWRRRGGCATAAAP